MLETAGAIGGVVLRSHDDGRTEVLEAPPMAEISCALLAQPSVALAVDPAGNLRLADQVTYRPLRLRQTLAGDLLLVCERVR